MALIEPIPSIPAAPQFLHVAVVIGWRSNVIHQELKIPGNITTTIVTYSFSKLTILSPHYVKTYQSFLDEFMYLVCVNLLYRIRILKYHIVVMESSFYC